MGNELDQQVMIEHLTRLLAAKDAEIERLKDNLNTIRIQRDSKHVQNADLKSELSEKDAVLAWYGDDNNYNHFPATSDPNCMSFVGFVIEKEAGDKAREVMAKYKKGGG